jgi:hypothetical protein
MGLYNFQKRFVPFIVNGEKTHTIRAKRKVAPKAGETLHLYTGLRQKGAALLMRAPCTKVEKIEISLGPFGMEITIDGERLSPDEIVALAKRDGFDSAASMEKFWVGRYPFEGHIIHWRFTQAL